MFTGSWLWPAGLLPGGLESLTVLLREWDGALLPQASAWVLLLALGLLCELRDPRSRCGMHFIATSYSRGPTPGPCRLGGCSAARPLRSLRWAPYVTMLPAPPGSRMAAICRTGPPASDLLLFRHVRQAAWHTPACMHPSSTNVPHAEALQVLGPHQYWHVCSAGELDELQSPPLLAAVMAERARLQRLHAHLFGKAEGAIVSLESFLWAHCLVRSRALELSAPAQRVCTQFAASHDCPASCPDQTAESLLGL